MHTKSGLRVEIKDADKGTFVSIFSTFGVKDHDGDVTRPDAFDDGAKMPVSAYGHSSWMGNLPVGKAVIKNTKTEAQAHGEFFMDTQDGHDTFVTVKRLHEDGMGEWSYGFDVVKHSFGEWPEGESAEPKSQVRFLEKQKVHEVSPVLVGAGINTLTTAAKGLLSLGVDALSDEDIQSIFRGLPTKRIKELLGPTVVSMLEREWSTKSGSNGPEEFDVTLARQQMARWEQHRFASGR